MSIAKADDELHANEAQMLRKVANILGISSSDIARFRESG
jgi:uncharacterized tellurite resistance protein B-like protein